MDVPGLALAYALQREVIDPRWRRVYLRGVLSGIVLTATVVFAIMAVRR